LQWILDDWMTSCFKDNIAWQWIWGGTVRFATLINNTASNFDVNYSALDINKLENDVWFRFPWEQWW